LIIYTCKSRTKNGIMKASFEKIIPSDASSFKAYSYEKPEFDAPITHALSLAPLKQKKNPTMKVRFTCLSQKAIL